MSIDQSDNGLVEWSSHLEHDDDCRARNARPATQFGPLRSSGTVRSVSTIDPRYRAMVLVMAWGTLRIGEAFGTAMPRPISSPRGMVRQSIPRRGARTPGVRRSQPPGCGHFDRADLRHTSVALAIASDAHPKAIQARMGHSSIAVTLDWYGHLFPELDEAIATSFDERFVAARAERDSDIIRPVFGDAS
jgi:hypothetical protein